MASQNNVHVGKPPFFDGNNYDYWKTRIMVHLKAMGKKIWGIVNEGFIILDEKNMSEADDANELLNDQAMNVLYGALDINKFNRVKNLTTVYEIWNKLLKIHEETSTVKEAKLYIFKGKFSEFSMKKDEDVSTMFNQLNDIVNELKGLGFNAHPKLQEARFWPHFKDCIGAIDGTHIPVTVPLGHGYPSQNVMAVCDFDMRFTFAVTGWPGSVHNTRVLLDTFLTYKEQFPHPPDGKYYLVDSGYPNRKGFLAPYKGQRYHVSEWQHGQHPAGLKEVFNHAHSSLRNVIERSFGVLKMKLRILLNLPSYLVNKQSKIIVTCMALHNFIRDSVVHDVHFE
ncbi:uncharacterized protein LOC101780464 [Setaria italica]|uniref:uncharacterized protein LOC101780464 n=1 Tax=Setaria italica TaxID=4555 RepID=UPI000350B01E|nr:uncharacterized protein LOC101780464 [Setaria italica]XP_004956820.1 uncharacterized protein LOC101780464 [Setaria italica]XP_004956821.1 uncharacterized protein LOC101780464 [Setaria italica]